jgi:hypothetical protein
MSILAASFSSRLRSGDVVEVLPCRQILETLDENGQLDNMPFMPEMIKYCGQRFIVSKRVNYVCVEGNGIGGLNKTVTLQNVRCDGVHHGDCQKTCSIFWKEAWLKKCANDTKPVNGDANDPKEAILEKRLKTRDGSTGEFICQSTRLNPATSHIGSFSKMKYLMKVILSGNKGFIKSILDLSCFIRFKVSHRLSNTSCRFLKGTSLKTPTISLDLQAGDWVEIKSPEEIAATIDQNGKNRGLAFTPEMHHFCGKRFKVKQRLEKMISEVSGHIVELTDTVLLEDVTCQGVCKSFGCSRQAYHYWREIWLKKI